MKISETHRYAIEKDGKVISRIYVRVPSDLSKPVHLFRFWTRKDSRRQGYGRRVFKEAVDKWGHRNMMLRVSPEKGSGLTVEDLFSIYESYGFERKEDTQTMIRKGKFVLKPAPRLKRPNTITPIEEDLSHLIMDSGTVIIT